MKADLYSPTLVDHARKPRQNQLLSAATHKGNAVNQTCGDEVQVTFVVKDGVVEQAGIVTEGCALSTAAGSVLSEWIVGKSITDVATINEQILSQLLMIQTVPPSRLSCLMLPIQAAQRALLY